MNAATSTSTSTSTDRPKRRKARSRISVLFLTAACFIVSTANYLLWIGNKLQHDTLTTGRTLTPARPFESRLISPTKVNVTSLLLREQPFPYSDKVFKFQPGSLSLSPAKALQHCHINLTTYASHIPGGNHLLASVSHHHKLLYKTIPKSSSSTGRIVMSHYLQGTDRRTSRDEFTNWTLHKGYDLISFIREPLDRFYSQYEEAFYRIGPWMGDKEMTPPKMNQWYEANKHKVLDRYPYLYEGMESMTDYRRLYCPRELLEGYKEHKCDEVPSIDVNGTLARRFEKFVRDYDGLHPWDVHLNLQVSHLVFGISGDPLPMTRLYNGSDVTREWRSIAHAKGVEINDGDIPRGRQRPRRFNVDLISDGTKRKICNMMALDYCCLNIKLPTVCEVAEEGNTDANNVFCKMRELDGRVTIESWW